MIFISDFPLDLPTQEAKASDITLAAATTAEIAWGRIPEIVKQFWRDNGKLPTQTAIATETGLSQSWISKLAAKFIGGWQCLKQLITSLVAPLKTGSTESESVSVEENWVAQWLEVAVQNSSLELADSLNALIQTFGWQGWRRILTQTTASLRLQLLAALFRDGFEAEHRLSGE